MTLTEAIEAVDSAKYNACSRMEKIAWLDRLDRQVKLFMERYGDVGSVGYTMDTDPDTQLLLPAPFDEAYLRSLEAQIDYQNGEFTRFNNAMALFSSVRTAFENHYNRTHIPLGTCLRYF